MPTQIEGERNNCSRHPKDVAGITDMKQLAEMIGDLHYAILRDLLMELQVKLHNDAVNDIKKNKSRLGHLLQKASNWLLEAAVEIEKAWEISRHFMTDKKDKYDKN